MSSIIALWMKSTCLCSELYINSGSSSSKPPVLAGEGGGFGEAAFGAAGSGLISVGFGAGFSRAKLVTLRLTVILGDWGIWYVMDGGAGEAGRGGGAKDLRRASICRSILGSTRLSISAT